jgi:phage/plasmid-like protein (TIGR03299 family)
MSANVSVVNGKSEAFTALTPAWWDRDEEYVADHYLTSEEVWGDRGLLNFEYELRPIFDEIGQEVGGWRRTVRKDTGVTVGVGMKKGYKIVQPREAFRWMDSLMMDGVMRYASAGVLGDGNQIWVLGCIPPKDGDQAVDEFRKYVLWLDDFTGGKSLLWFPCFTRVVCENTANIAKSERCSQKFPGIRHSGDVDAKLESARLAIVAAEEAFLRYNADCHKMLETTYSPQQAGEYLEKLLPTPRDPSGMPVTGRAATIHERKVGAIRRALEHPVNTVGDMTGTFYQLYNGVTYAVDHSNVFSFKGQGAKRTKNRWISLMTGQGAELKAKALDVALTMCG